MKKIQLKKLLFLPSIIFGMTLFITASAFAQTADDLNNETISQEEERTYSIEQTDKSHYPKLLQKAGTEGKIRIIVGVKASFKPEGWHRSSEAVNNQRSGIATAQDALLKSVLIPDESTVKKFKYIPLMAMEVDESALRNLMNNPMVNSIEEDKLHIPLLYDTIPLIGADTGEADYSTGYTGQGQTIAILDTGVDKTHSFLSGKVVAEACFSSSGTSLCPNGQKEQIGSGAGVNCSSSIDGCEHGTHVAGIAAGKRTKCSDGTYCMRGVAPKANIIAIQVFSRSGNSTTASDYDIISALEHVYSLRNTYNISSVNMSIGSVKGYPSYCDSYFLSEKVAIDQLRSVGIATVIASGNGDSNHNGYINALSTPACISTAVSVGATNMFLGSEEIAGYSNSASFLSLLAPGGYGGFWSMFGECDDSYGIYSSIPGGWCTMPGTSQAAPHVAGAWALMKEKYPSASVSTILSAFKSTGKNFTDVNGVTTPRIRVDKALAALPTLPNLSPYKPSGWSDKIVVSTTSGSTTDSSTIYSTDNLYVSFAIVNDSSTNISTTFYTAIYVDGLEKQTISKTALNAGYYGSYVGANIGALSAGTHTIKIVIDSTGAVSESNENDNEYSKTITVTAGCTYTISPTSKSFTSTGGTGSITVTPSSSSCTWTATESLDWVSITSGSSGTGSWTVSYSVSANTSTSSRSGNMTIAGQTFTIAQSGLSCTYTITPTSQTFTSSAGTGSVTVTPSSSSCTWTATESLSWVTITSGSSGTGSGTVNYSVSANTSTSSRSGNMTIAGQTFTITQAGEAQNNCAATVSSSLVVHIPVITYSGSNYWADLAYNSSNATLSLTNAGVVNDSSPYSSCTASTLSSDYKLHIPVLMLDGVSYWADLQYNGSVFVISGGGQN